MKHPLQTKVGNENGFTMIELMVAGVILAWMTLSLVLFLGNMMTHNSNNDRRTQAVTLAEEKIEDLKTLAINNDLTAADGGTDTPAGGIFTRTWIVNAGTTPTSIKVYVDWDGIGDTDVTLTTMIFD